VRLREPRSYFPYILASPWSFPWPRHKCEELGDDWRKPENLIGNGPFMLAEYDEDQMVLTANPHWTGPRGNVREIVATLRAKSDREALEGWRDGRYDFLHVWTPFGDEDDGTLRDVIPSLGLEYVGFRADRAPFMNALVRKAFAHALDRERFQASREGLGRAASLGGAIPPAMPGHSHRAAPGYDLDAARNLLAEAGYANGHGLPEVRLVVPNWLKSAGDLAEQWAEIGARVTVVPIPAPVGFRDLDDAHFWFTGWTADYPDPDGFFRGLFQLAWPFYRDEDLHELLERARVTVDQNARMRLYHEVDRLWVLERAALIPISYPRTMLLRRPWVEGLSANPLLRAQVDQAVVKRPDA